MAVLSEEEATCGGGCCSPPPPPQRDSPLPQDSCCSPDADGDACNDGAKEAIVETKLAAKCTTGCCGETKSDQPVSVADTRSKSPVECTSGCCGEATADQPAPSAATPCEVCLLKDGAKPCCDDSCLLRIATRECQEQCSRDGELSDRKSRPGSSSSSSSSGKTSKPCRRHVDSANSRFRPFLDSIGCICRVLLSRNLESCCVSSHRSSLESSRRRRKSPRTSKPSPGGQRPGGPSTACCSSGDGCCKPEPAPKRASSCCSDENCASEQPVEKQTSCQDSCCGESDNGDDIQPTSLPAASGPLAFNTQATRHDVEKGGQTLDHIILTVQGMTCTGCETKLSKSLGGIIGASNVQTSLILSRTEFDLDISQTTIDLAILHLKRTTGFEFKSIATEGHELEVLLPSGLSSILDDPLPRGIIAASVTDDKTLRISYDPTLIGARDLVSSSFGRPLELAPLRGDPSIAAGNKHVRHVGLMTLLSACLTIPVLVLEWAPLPEHDVAYSATALALATVIQVVIAGPFYPAAIKALVFARVLEMDLLIVLSTSAAYIFSVVAFGLAMAGRPLSTGEFFETSTLLVTLIMLGRYISALARQKAVESISIRSLQQSTALLVQESGTSAPVDARLLQYGDTFRVPPETRIVTDGLVVSGSSEADESMITGESRLVEKAAGSPAVAGSVNASGTLDVRVTQLPGDNTISKIANMVDEAKLSKPKIQELSDKVAGYFVPVVAALTVVTFLVWLAVGIAVRKQTGSEAAVNATTFAIAVLIVSCPCAIGLAVPMVVVVAGGVAADRGVIFKTAESIEIARRTSHVVFDKTGTLTLGALAVVKEHLEGDMDHVRSALLGLVSEIKHPVSVAVASYLRDDNVQPKAVQGITSVPGKGVEGTVGGITIRAGNSRWLGVSDAPLVTGLLAKNLTVFCVLLGKELVAVFGLQDSLRPEAVATVASLQARGIAVSMISGDDEAAVQDTARQLGIPSSHVRARCSPADKRDYIRAAEATAPTKKDAKHKHSVIMFVGDGTNDAVALAAADLGVHMASGTDVARTAADAVLVRADLAGILTLIDLSRAAFRRITFNFAWSFVYNLFAVLLAAGAFVRARIPPAYAGLGEIVSVLPVVAIALGLKWVKL